MNKIYFTEYAQSMHTNKMILNNKKQFQFAFWNWTLKIIYIFMYIFNFSNIYSKLSLHITQTSWEILAVVPGVWPVSKTNSERLSTHDYNPIGFYLDMMGRQQRAGLPLSCQWNTGC